MHSNNSYRNLKFEIVADVLFVGDSCRGNKINYSVSGSGKPLILVHGFGMFLSDCAVLNLEIIFNSSISMAYVHCHKLLQLHNVGSILLTKEYIINCG